ncbi:protein stum-like [Silurus asotus]|uniref:Protein stum-like n=1 Tax=Silurus asotus TaxID=30991 RepID=A0AAD5B1U6_SILAS|nr:protein stum-like [Silurus asotus]
MFVTFDNPLRPLLYAAEIAAAAAGVYFLFKKRRYRVLRTGSGDGDVRALGPGLMCDTDEGRDAQRCSAERKDVDQKQLGEMNQCLPVSTKPQCKNEARTKEQHFSIQMWSFTAEPPGDLVLEQMEMLLGSVQQLNKEVSEIRSICEQIKSERQREQEAYRILRPEWEEMREALKSRDKSYKEALDTTVQLENKIFKLVSEMNKVNDFLRQLEEELSESNRTYKKEQKDLQHEKNLHEHLIDTHGSEEISLLRKLDPITAVAVKTLRRSNEETEIVLRTQHSIARLSDILKERRLSCKRPENQQNSALKTIEEQKLDYDQICLHKGHNILKEKHSELLKRYEQEREAHNDLKLQCEQMMKKDADKQKLLMMEKENLDLKRQVGKLVETVWRMEVMLSRRDAVCRAMKKERERLREAHHISNFVYKKTMKQRDDLLLKGAEVKEKGVSSSTSGVVVQVREKKGPLRAAIPYMPFPVAVICLFLNTFVPGLGTLISAFTVLCGARTDLPDRHVCCVFWLNIAAALIQIITAVVMVGWIMSIFWGMDMVILASEH